MVCTIKLKLLNGMSASDAWECLIELPLDFSLEEVHFTIQDALEFDNDHMYEFSISNSLGGKKVDEFACDSDKIYTTTIENLLKKSKGKKIFYLFDYGDNWIFQISSSRKKPFLADVDTTYPRIAEESGTKPTQYPDWEE
jgi:hypothetical protein